ncbi:CTL-like protein 2, partial [Gryllus bimaculatus]
QVCVEKCPTEVYYGKYYRDMGRAATERSKGICRGEKPSAAHMQDAIEYHHCAAWYLPLRSVGRRCIYVRKEDFMNDTLYKSLEGELKLKFSDIERGAQNARSHSQERTVWDTIVINIEENWVTLVVALVIAMVLCMIYIVIMRWFAWILVWVSLIGVLALLGFCCYASWTKYAEARNEEDLDPTRGPIKISWLILFIASCIVLVVVFLLIIFLRTRIRLATALISEASRAVGNVMSTLFFPLGPWIFQMAVIAWTVAVWVYVASSGNPNYEVRGLDNKNCICETYSNGDSCEPFTFNKQCSSAMSICGDVACAFKRYESRATTSYFHAINIIGFFWILCFISAFSDMALAGTFSTWYWTRNKSDVPFFALTQSVGRAVRYHLGTLAFGSLILAICRLIRTALEYVEEQLRKYDSGLAKCLMCCCKCFFMCLESFIKFINRNAYIMCAIHGKNFCRSSRDGFNLVMRNIIRVLVLDKVTDFLLLLGKLLITVGVVAVAFLIFDNDVHYDGDEDIEEYAYYLVPIFIVAISTYFVACVFFSVYAMAIDTIFLCFLEDLERNDGSPARPYYMSKKLLEILGKKNDNYMERMNDGNPSAHPLMNREEQAPNQ